MMFLFIMIAGLFYYLFCELAVWAWVNAQYYKMCSDLHFLYITLFAMSVCLGLSVAIIMIYGFVTRRTNEYL